MQATCKINVKDCSQLSTVGRGGGCSTHVEGVIMRGISKGIHLLLASHGTTYDIVMKCTLLDILLLGTVL